MIDDSFGMNQEEKDQESKAQKERKKKIRRWVLGILGAALPYLLLIMCVIILGSGIGSAFSMAGAFFKGLFQGTDTGLTSEAMERLNSLTEEEILEMIRNKKFDESFYDTMMINEEEFVYLLESVSEYNKEKNAGQTISVEYLHEYVEWVENTAAPGVTTEPGVTGTGEENSTETSSRTVTEGTGDRGGGEQTETEGGETAAPSGHYEQRTERKWEDFEVRASDIETFHLNWQLVYALCLADTIKQMDSWEKEEADDGKGGTITHYGTNHEEIDYVISHVAMKYEYVTDLARSSKVEYSMEDCLNMVHNTVTYGDPETEEGRITIHYPRSVLARAYSGYSCSYYLIEGNKLTGLVTTSDMKHFELIASRFCPNYTFGYFSMLLHFIPGAADLAERLNTYYENREEGYLISKVEFEPPYVIGGGISVSSLPTSTEPITGGDFGDLTDYGDLAFDEGLGGRIFEEACKYLEWAYDQGKRWMSDNGSGVEGYADCSSLVWNAIYDAGLDPNAIFNGRTAAAEGQGLEEKGMLIPIEEIQQGDLIFYSYEINGRWRNISHVAIYAGNDQIIHAQTSKKIGRKVAITPFYKKNIVYVARPYKVQ